MDDPTLREDIFTPVDAPEHPHAREAGEVLAALATGEPGLDADTAARRLERFGPNAPPTAGKRSLAMRFLSHFHHILIYVLLGAALVTFLLGHPLDTGVILAVVLANAVIGFVQEGRAEKAMAAIQGMLAPQANVIRDGRRMTVKGADLVPGDIVVLEAGDKVPADLRLIRSHGLQVQEAILTGESVPVEKAIAPVKDDAALGDRLCMAYSGTLVTAGQGRGVVVATGARTEIGRISGMLSQVETLTTPLVRQMNTFSKWLTLFILLGAGLLLVFGYFVRHQTFLDMFMAVVGLSVAAIPEGLPAVLTITLAIGVQAMARRNAIVRRLPAIETLGSVSVICTDKTGTLTRNEMVVTSAAVAGRAFEVEGDGYAPDGRILQEGKPVSPGEDAALAQLALAAGLCNDAQLHEDEGSWRVNGDPMEGALLAFAAKSCGGLDRFGKGWDRRDAIPFDSRHRYMATLHRDREGDHVIFVKGAPETVLAMCRSERCEDGSERELDPQAWHAIAEHQARQGQRMLAFAVRAAGSEENALTQDSVEGRMAFLGLVGMIDPPRPEAVAAVAECQGAGIKVKMITGDHAGTAAAIGREIGLELTEQVLTGVEIDGLGDGALSRTVLETDIFARTSPEHKLRLVKALQSQELTVAMTGDGVNDAPALKRADAGIAMGQKGSEAAREAAEIVLADDNFASIAAAVREGRTVYDNITKVISWTLPTNGGEAMTILIALLFGMAMPITPVQILWVNLVTAITLGIALAFEPTEANTMQRSPRPRNEPILNARIVWQIVFVSALFFAGVFGIFAHAQESGYDLVVSQTMAVNTLVVLEIAYLFFVRNIHGSSLSWKAVKGTKIVWACVLSVTALQFALTYAPPLQAVFGTAAVGFIDGIIVVLVGVALFALLEIEKQLRLALQRAS